MEELTAKVRLFDEQGLTTPDISKRELADEVPLCCSYQMRVATLSQGQVQAQPLVYFER